MKKNVIGILCVCLCVIVNARVKYNTFQDANKPLGKTTTQTQKKETIKRSNVKNYTDSLDKQIEFFRNRDNSIPGAVQFSTYSLKVFRVISEDEGIFILKERYYYCSTEKGGNLIDEDRAVARIYISGLKLEDYAEGDSIKLKDKQTLWRIGAKRIGDRSYKRYTLDRSEAEKFINDRKTKK